MKVKDLYIRLIGCAAHFVVEPAEEHERRNMSGGTLGRQASHLYPPFRPSLNFRNGGPLTYYQRPHFLFLGPQKVALATQSCTTVRRHVCS